MAEVVETINAIAKKTFKGGVIVEKVTYPLSSGNLKLQNTKLKDNPAMMLER